MTKGTVKDISDPSVETAAPFPTIRLCYLMPSDLSCMTKAEFLALRYDRDLENESETNIRLERNQIANQFTHNDNPGEGIGTGISRR